MARTRGGSRRWVAWLALLGIVGVVGLLWFGPRLIDWSRYKPEVASLISKQLGVTVELRGGLQIVLLPQPRITAADVRVSGPGVVGPIRWLRGSLDPRALLLGKLSPRDLELVEAELTLPVSLATGGSYDGNTSVLIEDSRLQLEGGPDWLPRVLERIDGRLTLGGGQNGGFNRLFAFDGEARLNEQPIGVSIEGRTGGSITLNIAHGPSASDLVVSGARDGDGNWRGRATLVLEEAGFLSTLNADGITRLIGEGPAAMDASLVINSAGAMTVTLESLDSAHLTGRGEAVLTPGDRPALDLTLAISRADYAETPISHDHYARDLSKILAVLSDIDTTLNLNARSLTLGTDTFQQVELFAETSGDGVRIEHAHVILPGKSDVTLSGAMTPSGDGWQFEGEAALISSDFRGLVTWLSPQHAVDLASLPDDRVRRASLNTKLLLDGRTAEVTELSGQIDDTTWVGALTIPLGPSETDLSVVLQGDRLNLDRYLSAYVSDTAPDWLISPRDRHISLYLDQATFGGFPADGVVLTLQAEAGQLPGIDVAIANLAGASGTAVMQLDGPSSSRIAIRLMVATPDRFLGAIGLPARQASRFASFGTTALSLDLSYAPDKGVGYALDAIGERGDMRLNGLIELALPPVITVSDGAYNGPDLSLFDFAGRCQGASDGGWYCGDLSAATAGLTLSGSATVLVPDSGGRIVTVTLADAIADLGLFAADSGLPVLPEGDLTASGSLTGRGADIDSALRGLAGTLSLNGAAGLTLRRGSGGQLGNLDRLREKLAKAFGAPHPLSGNLAISPEQLSLTLTLPGDGSAAAGEASLDRATQQLTADLRVQVSGQSDPALLLTASGPLGAPGVKLNGSWISGR